jgi:IS1 family transposase
MNRLPTEKRRAIVGALTNGAGINATSRQVGVSHVTVLKLLAEIGAAALDYQRAMLVNLPCRRIQCDEIWSFVGAKKRNVRPERSAEWGDAWTWTAICEETKIVPCWHVGVRDADAALLFMEDLASRLANRVQLSTDGHNAYLSAVESAFGWNGIDYAMLVKLYGESPDGDKNRRKYSPGRLISTEKHWVMGEPDMEKVSTSFAEAQNMTMRQNIRRLTRLTNGHSKKLENHVHAMALYFLTYNFVRKHTTLTKLAGGIHITPAMAAGVSDHVWTLDEVLALLDRPRSEGQTETKEDAVLVSDAPSRRPYRRRVRR